jgi:hypothetical protein
LDVIQIKNVYNEHPDIVKELAEILASYAPHTRRPAAGDDRNRLPSDERAKNTNEVSKP